MKDILIVVPCYNCAIQAERVARSIDQFIQNFRSFQFKITKVVFIDNLSRDATYATLTTLIAQFKHPQLFAVEKNSKNLGLGGTHKRALQMLKNYPFDFLVVLHGDDQANISDLESLLELSKTNGFRTVLGSRFINTSLLENYSALRRLGNIFLNRVYSVVLKQTIYDLGSGLNLFSKQDFLNTAEFHSFDNGFTFNMDLLIFLSQKEKPILFSPIRWRSIDEKSNASSFLVGCKTLVKIFLWKCNGPSIWAAQEKQN